MKRERDRLQKSSTDGRETPSTQSQSSLYNPRQFSQRTFPQSSSGDLYPPVLVSTLPPGPSDTTMTSQSGTHRQQPQPQRQSPKPNDTGTSSGPTSPHKILTDPAPQQQSLLPKSILDPINSPRHSPALPPHQQNLTTSLETKPQFNLDLNTNHPQTRRTHSRRNRDNPQRGVSDHGQTTPNNGTHRRG